MIDLTVAMMKTLFLRLLIPFSLLFSPQAQVTPGLYVLSPSEGQAVAGMVEIIGSVPDVSFDYAEVSYVFSGSDAPNWFVINRLNQPVMDGSLAVWDTTLITDGLYRLKVTVYNKDGSSDELIVNDIRVANYTHMEEGTPTTSAAELKVQATADPLEPTATTVQTPLPTDLPANPAAISPREFKFSLGSGAVLAVLCVGVIAVYAFYRRRARK